MASMIGKQFEKRWPKPSFLRTWAWSLTGSASHG